MNPDPIDPAAGGAASFLEALRPLDQVGLGLLAVFLVLGGVRGLWWQVIRLVGLLGAGLLARALAPRWSPSVTETSGLPPVVAQGLVWFAVFVLGLLAASLLGMIGKKSLDTMQLGLADRFGGALAGAATGLLLHAALLLGLSYLGPQPWTADALRGTRSQTLLRSVSTRLPVLLDRESVAAREIRSWLGTSDLDAEPAPEAGAPPTPNADDPLPLAPDELAPEAEPAAPAGGGQDGVRTVPVEASAPRQGG